MTEVNSWRNIKKGEKRALNELHIFCPKKIMYSSPEVLVGKGMARTGFEVALKFLGFDQGFKGNIELEFQSRFFANALPEGLFRYVSKSSAL